MAATADTDQRDVDSDSAVVSEAFGTAAGVGMRSRRAAPRPAAAPVPAPSTPSVKLLAGMTEPRRHRGMAARRSGTNDTARPKPFSLLMPPDMADWVSDFAHYGRVDRSEVHRELVHILMDCQDGLLAKVPSGEGFVDFLLDRIMERRRVANNASAAANPQ